VPSSPPATLEEAQAELLDILQTSLGQSEVEEIALDSSSVLADLSSKEIDDILSSGPCSPQSEHGSAGFDFSSVELVEPQNLSGSEIISLDMSQELLNLLAPAQEQTQPSNAVVKLDPAYSLAPPPSQPSPAHSFRSALLANSGAEGARFPLQAL